MCFSLDEIKEGSMKKEMERLSKIKEKIQPTTGKVRCNIYAGGCGAMISKNWKSLKKYSIHIVAA